jgi:hypothetical protein
MRVWTGLAVVISSPLGAQGQTSSAGSAPAATAPPAVTAVLKPAEVSYHGNQHQRDYPFAKALQKQLAGEGGEGGIGFSASGPDFRAPALDADQLRMALVGNTVRKDQAVALYFNPNGMVQGWKRDWSKAEMSQCPTPLGEDHEIENGVCYTAAVNPIAGRYAIKGNQVCMPAYSGKPQDGEACYYFAFVTKFVMIGDGKRTYGSGKDLVVGRVLDTFRKRSAKD